ncbi:MAG: diacylglycerol/lipid kinase family protein [Clostridia bacterium]
MSIEKEPVVGFVINPVSGNGQGAKVWEVVKAELQQQDIPFVAIFTEKQASLHETVGRLATKQNVSIMVAIGGDGTVHDVLNAMDQAKVDWVFGVIAAGSGNDFARAHGVPQDPKKALKLILSKEGEKRNDLLKANGRVAATIVGMGLDGQVAKTTNEAIYKNWLNRFRLGALSYVVSLVRVLMTYQPRDVQLTVDGKPHRLTGVWLIAIANTPNFGGGMRICPQALPDDGWAEVCVVNGVTRWTLLRVFPQVYKGQHVKHPAVRFFQGKSIRVESNHAMIVHADGEVIDTTPLHVEVAEQGLRLKKNTYVNPT